MEKLFYLEPERKSLEAVVTEVRACDPKGLYPTFLDQTIFYPESGGQCGDIGSLTRLADGLELKIVDSQKEDEHVCHLVSGKLEKGDKVVLNLDWPHRLFYMQEHTAQHIISGLLFSQFSIGTLSVHMGQDAIAIETDKAIISQDIIDGLEAMAQSVVIEGHEVSMYEESHEEAEAEGLRRTIKVDGPVRLVRIAGVDLIACGGVHVGNTREIQSIEYSGSESIRGHARLFFKVGQKALEARQARQKAVMALERMLSCSTEELEAMVQRLIDQASEQKRAYSSLLALYASTLIQGPVTLLDLTGKLGFDGLGQASKDLDELCLCAVDGNRWLMVLKGSYESLDYRKALAASQSKGGGKKPMYQGFCPDPKALLAAFSGLIN